MPPSLDNIFGGATPSAPSGAPSLDNIFGGAPTKTPSVSKSVFTPASRSPDPRIASIATNTKPVDTSGLFSGFLKQNNFSNESTTPVTDQGPSLFEKATGAKFSDVMSGLPKASKDVSDTINKEIIQKPADLLANTDFIKQASAGIDSGSESGMFAQEMLHKFSYGLNSLSGVTGGLYQAPDNPTEDFTDKALKVFSTGIGAAVGISSFGSVLSELPGVAGATAGLTNLANKYPLMAKYLAPYIKPLVTNSLGFAAYGQLNPNLAGDMKKRALTLATDIGTAPLYTALGMIKSAGVSIPASFGLGFGMAKLSGASNQDAIASGLALGVMDAFGRVDGSRGLTPEEIQTKLKEEAFKVLNQYSETKLTEDSTPAELQKAYYAGAHQTHPDVGGTQEAFTSLKNAYDLLSRGAVSKVEEGQTTPEQSIALLKEGIQEGIQTHGEDVTHQALQEHLGVDQPTATRLVNAAKFNPEKVEGIAPEKLSLDNIFSDKIKAEGGISVNLKTGESPTEGYSFSPDKSTEFSVPVQDFNESHVDSFIEKHYDELTSGRLLFGGWVDGGNAYLDLSKNVASEHEAVVGAKQSNQIGIYDVKNGETKYTDKYTLNQEGVYQYEGAQQGGNEKASQGKTQVIRSAEGGFVNPGEVADQVAKSVKQLHDTVEHAITVGDVVGKISDSIYKNEGARTAFKVRLTNLVEEARRSSTPKEREHVYHFMEDHKFPLTNKERTQVLPLVESMDKTLTRLRQEARAANVYITGDIAGEHTPRNAIEKGGVFDKALEAYQKGKKVILRNGNSLSKSVGAGSKHRVFRALTDEAGKRTVVAVKNKQVTAFDKNKMTSLGTLKLKPKEEFLKTEIEPILTEVKKIQSSIDNLQKLVDARTPVSASKMKELGKEIDDLVVRNKILSALKDTSDAKLNSLMTTIKQKTAEFNTLGKVKQTLDQTKIARQERLKVLQSQMIEMTNLLGEIESKYNPNELDQKVFQANDGKQYKIGQATTREIEANTKTRYYKDPLANYALAIERTANAVRAARLLDKIKTSPDYKDSIIKEGPGVTIPTDFKTTRLQQFRGYWMEPHLAEAFDDLAKRQEGGLHIPIYDEINNLLISALVINPIMHFPNVAMGWGSAMAANGLPFKLDFGETLKEVINKSPDYLRWLEHGAPFQYIRQTNSEFADALLKDFTIEVTKDPSRYQEMAEMLGHANPVEWVKGLEKISSDATWIGNDTMLYHALKEYQRTNNVSEEKAIAEVTKRLADYRIPPRVLGSRALSVAMQNNALLMFMRYHYTGVLKPWFANIGDAVLPRGEGATGEEQKADAQQQRYSAMRTLAYFGAMWFIWQYGLNKVLQKATGNPDSYMSMPGAMRLPQNIIKSIQLKTPVPIITSTFSLNPGVKLVGSILDGGYDINNFMKPVFGPGGEGLGALLGNSASPYNAISGAFNGTGSWTDYAESLGGIYTPKTTTSTQLFNGMLNVEKPQVVSQMKAKIAAGDTAGAIALAHDFNERLKVAIKNADISNHNSGSPARVNYYFQTFPNGLGQKGYAIRMPSAQAMANYEAKQGLSTGQKELPGAGNKNSVKGAPSDINNHSNPGTVKTVTSNGVTLYNRMSNELAVKAAMSGGKIQPYTQLDHIVPLEGGGTNEIDNLTILTTIEDGINQPLEDFIGKEVKAGRMNLAQSTEIAIRFKAGLGQKLTPKLMNDYQSKYGSKPLTLAQAYDYVHNVGQ